LADGLSVTPDSSSTCEWVEVHVAEQSSGWMLILRHAKTPTPNHAIATAKVPTAPGYGSRSHTAHRPAIVMIGQLMHFQADRGEGASVSAKGH
jgi:hypothetical protein